jgi:putative N6-adenine-specific DNA methylase
VTNAYFAGCPLGIEEALASELSALGAHDIVPNVAGVRFDASREVVARTCLWLRTATRVQEILLERTVRNDEELYEAVRSIRWTKLLGPRGTLGVDASLHQSFYTDPNFLVHRVKDAVVDRLRLERGARPDVDRHRPDLPIFAFLHGESLQVSRVWAPSLHRRGYRDPRSKSPLNEALAAGLLQIAGWLGDGHFLDPMCGSGTLLVEAAMVAERIAPGLGRPFPFESWPDADPHAQAQLVEEARDARRPAGSIRGFDRDREAVEVARGAVARAGVTAVIERRDVSDIDLREPPTLVVTNPPWGQRMGEGEDLARSWKELGRFFKGRCGGSTAWVLSGNPEVTRNLGMKTSRRVPLQVGPIECRFLRYEIRGWKREEVPPVQ